MNSNQNNNRWALPDLSSTIQWAGNREKQKISVAIDPLGEYAQDALQASESVQKYLSAIDQIKQNQSKAAIAVKPSAIGLNFNQSLAGEHLLKILERARDGLITVEIDMEGTPSVNAVCKLAQDLSASGYSLVLALQAYLDRTHSDIEQSLAAGLKIRLVKGAYRGDCEDFVMIQQRFMNLFSKLLASGQPFDVGTHDPELLQQMKTLIEPDKVAMVSFGFLKGLAELTKVEMAKSGFSVAEYVPYGDNRRAYETRRNAYLKRLEEAGRKPVP